MMTWLPSARIMTATSTSLPALVGNSSNGQGLASNFGRERIVDGADDVFVGDAVLGRRVGNLQAFIVVRKGPVSGRRARRRARSAHMSATVGLASGRSRGSMACEADPAVSLAEAALARGGRTRCAVGFKTRRGSPG